MRPTTLDRLYRFSRHEVEGSTAQWLLSAGMLETKTRLYRVMYQCGPILDEIEVTIHVKKDIEKLGIFLGFLEMVVEEKEDRDSWFRLACLDLLMEDPWLLMLRDQKQKA